MKFTSTCLVFLLCVFLSLIVNAQQSEWKWQYPSPQSNGLFDVFSFDENNALAVGHTATILITSDGGTNWEDISEGLPERWIARVAADPLESNVVYVTISGYRWDEFLPHVFKSEDYGENWEDISANLPETPVNDIIINWPDNQILFVATDVGVFATYDGGGEWSPLGEGIPNVVVNDLVLHKPTNKLVAATYGRSMYSYDLEQDPTTSVHEENKLFEVHIFPNPFTTEISIKTNGTFEISEVNIFDLSGKPVRKIKVSNSRQIKWDGRNEWGEPLPTGTFIMKVFWDNEITTHKIIKE